MERVAKLKETTLSNIPRTGRIGRFINILEKQVDEETLLKIAQASPNYNLLNQEEKALWWKNAVEKMEAELGKDTSAKIMHQCGAKCCGNGQRRTAKKLMEETGSLEGMIEKLNSDEYSKGKFKYKLIDDNTINGQYYKCFCGQVKNSKQKHDNDIYCQCTVEFNRQFFMAALNLPVEVSLAKSILQGDKWCEFIVTLNRN